MKHTRRTIGKWLASVATFGAAAERTKAKAAGEVIFGGSIKPLPIPNNWVRVTNTDFTYLGDRTIWDKVNHWKLLDK